jgi:hypothetical protein
VKERIKKKSTNNGEQVVAVEEQKVSREHHEAQGKEGICID